MAVNLSPVGGVAGQFFDNNGDPLVGGKLFTYAAGTTTPQVTYTSSSGATPNSNPIILNAGGRVPSEIWLTDGLVYKFVLYSSTDQLIGSWDNIVGINSNFVNFVTSEEVQIATAGQTVFTLTTMSYQPGINNLVVYVDGVNQVEGGSYSFVETNSTTVTFTSGLHLGAVVKFVSAETVTTIGSNAAAVAYEPAGSGAVTTTVQAKLRETVSVKDFGAVGDGVTDDTAAIQAAIDYAQASSTVHCVVFPTGNYAISSTINIKGNFGYGFFIKGNKSTITASHDGIAFDCDAALPSPAPSFRLNLNINDLTIVGPGKANINSVGIRLHAANHGLNNVIITGFYKGLWGNGCLISEFIQCKFEFSEYGIYFDAFGGFSPNDNHFYKCNVIECVRAIKYTDFDYGSVTFIGCEIEGNNTGGNATDGVKVCEFAGTNGAGELTLIGTHFESNPGEYNLYYDSPLGRSLNILGCKIIPGDDAGSCVFVDNGDLYINGSQILKTTPNIVVLTANTGGAFVVGEIGGGTITGSSKIVRAINGRLITGGANAGSSNAGIATKGTSGVGAVVEGRLDFNNSSGTRLGYSNANTTLLDASAAYTTATGNGSSIFHRLSTIGIEPGANNAYTLGSGSLRWSEVFAVNGAINTSDAREKQQVRELYDAERAVAVRCKSLIRAFKWNSAVAEKGDGARIHFGVMAQDVQKAFEDEGLDANNYGIFCYDQWDEIEETRDEDGRIITQAIPKGDGYGVRYDELMAFIIAAL